MLDIAEKVFPWSPHGQGCFKYRLPIGVDMTEEVENDGPVEVYVIDLELKLTVKQEKFVYRFLSHGNGTQAAIEAGYAERSAAEIASENLRKPNIAKAIEDGKLFYAFQYGYEASWVRQEMKRLYDRCMAPVPVIKWNPESMDFEETGEYVFHPQTAGKVIEMMAKDAGMLRDVKDINVKASGVIQHDHVKKKLEFNKVREKVSQHRPERVH